MGELFSPWHIVVLLVPFLVILFLGTVIAVVVRSSGHGSSDARSEIMSVVPRPAKLIAVTLLGIAVTVGVIAGSVAAVGALHGAHHGPHSPILGLFLGLAGGTFVGCLFTVWVLGLGYVYGDARRRNMPYIPWLLVAFFVPNLLGFLLYFVLRKPIASPCPNCGQPKTPDQLFCPWCGYQTPSPSTAPAASPPQAV